MTKLLSKDDVNILTAQAQKFLCLLKESTMPDEVKDAWIDILPELTPEQFDELILALETSYADTQTQSIDDEFMKKLESI